MAKTLPACHPNFGYQHGGWSTTEVDKSTSTRAYGRLTRTLREARIRAGLSQQQLADLLGEPQSFVSKYESGARRLDLIELREIVGSLGVSFTDLIAELDRECANEG